MVASKRCKICTALDENNVSISGEYYGKLIPELIMKICGVELDARKSSSALICQFCVIQLVQTEMVIEKLHKAVHRLKKAVKESRPKTPSKDLSAGIARKNAIRKFIENNGEPQPIINESFLQADTEEKKSGGNSVLFVESSLNDKTQEEKDFEISFTQSNSKFRKFVDNDVPIEKEATESKKRKQKLALANYNNTPTDGNDGSPIPTKRKKDISVSKIKEETKDSIVEENKESQNNEQNANESKVKLMNCIICAKIFYSKSTLRNHVETAHIGVPLKACPYCSTEFRSQQKYESHVFSEKCKNNYTCRYPQCNKQFKTIHKMELHMHEKHSSQNGTASE